MLVSIIAAIGKNRELGKNNKLLWHIKKDMEHFKNLTTGHPVVMGRKTFESISRPLPNRTNIVITRDLNSLSSFLPRPSESLVKESHSRPHLSRSRENWNPDLVVASSIEEAIGIAKKHDSEEIFVIGGASIYAQAMKFADKLYLTLVDGAFDADAFFPDYSEFKNIVSKEEGKEGKYDFTFLELTRH